MYKMAENTVERIKEQLQCSICLSIYSEPKQLQCNHIFCQKCLESLNVRGLFRVITCPTCRQTTTLPVTGMAGLQSAFHIQSLLEVIKLGEQVTPNVAVRVEKPRPRKRRLYCPSHNDRVAELYCETCEQLICYKCSSKRGTHINHEYKEVDELCEGYMTEMKEGVAVLKKLCGEVSTQQAAFVAKIHEKSEQLHEDIDRVKTQLLSELNKMADEKIATLKSQIQDAETVQVQYSGGIEISSPFTQNSADVLSKRVAIVKQMKQTVNTFRAENMKPDNGADMMFLSPEDSSVKLGQVLQCYATGEGLKKFSNGNDITVHCFTAKGEPYTDKVSLECKLVSESFFRRTTPITPEPYPVTRLIGGEQLSVEGFMGGLGGIASKPNPPGNIGVGGLGRGFTDRNPRNSLGGGGLGFGMAPNHPPVSSDPGNQPWCGFARVANRPSPPVSSGVCQPLCRGGSKALGQPVSSGGDTSPPGVKNNSKFQSSQGKFRIPYRPTGSTGWYQLHITVCGQHIRGSPFRVEL